VNLVEARFAPPLRAGENPVRSKQTVPVHLVIGCGGVTAGNLAPTIEVVGSGIAGVMRPVDDGYLYNLRVPEAPAGTLLTVRVHPFGDGSAIDALLRVRG
jgi:hypothetical protein